MWFLSDNTLLFIHFYSIRLKSEFSVVEHNGCVIYKYTNILNTTIIFRLRNCEPSFTTQRKEKQNLKDRILQLNSSMDKNFENKSNESSKWRRCRISNRRISDISESESESPWNLRRFDSLKIDQESLFRFLSNDGALRYLHTNVAMVSFIPHHIHNIWQTFDSKIFNSNQGCKHF